MILSIETGRRQAKTHRRPLLAELTMLLAHGILHLIGYDHRTDAEEREMTAKTGSSPRLRSAGLGLFRPRADGFPALLGGYSGQKTAQPKDFSLASPKGAC